MMDWRRWRSGGTRLALALLLAAGTAASAGPGSVRAAGGAQQDDFESYGSAASGYTSPVGGGTSAAQPWKNAVGTGAWTVGEQAASAHFLQQTDTGTSGVYVLTNPYWTTQEPDLADESATLSGRLKVTGANSTYAGLVARFATSGGVADYYQFTMKKNSSSYQFYLERVTANARAAVPRTAGTANASGVSVSNTTLSAHFDGNGYLPLRLEIVENPDGSLTLEGFYDDQLVLSGTDTAPIGAGDVGLLSRAGSAAFDDIEASVEGGPAVPGTTVEVANATELGTALQAATPGTTVLLKDGNYAGLTITGVHGTAEAPITIRAKNKGMAVFNSSGLRFTDCSYVTLEDTTLSMASAGNWVRLTGSHHMRVTDNRFYSPSSVTPATSSVWILLDGSGSHDNRVDRNLMENKRDKGKFIVFDGVASGTGPYEITQHDVVEYNIFRHTLSRQPNESEGIRLGVSNLVALNAYATIQYNVFDQVDSDPEFVSVKSGANTIRYNYFIECLGSLTLRAGIGSSVYGNLFLGNGRTAPNPDPTGLPLGTGGVRVYGENHKIYNNYFEGLTGSVWDAAITVTTGDADDLLAHPEAPAQHYIAKNVTFVNNTLVNNVANIELGFERYGMAPENLTFANNLIVGSQGALIKVMTPPVGLAWSGNQMYPQQGATLATGLSTSLAESQVKIAFPMMVGASVALSQSDYAWLWTSPEYASLRTIGYKKLAANSPAINAAVGDYGSGGAYAYAASDMEGQAKVGIRDVGADEYTAGTPSDASPPSWSASSPLTLASVAPREARIQWPAAADDSGVAAYRIYRNGTQIDTVFADVGAYRDRGLQPGTSYAYQVRAIDQAERTASTNTLSVATPALVSVQLSGVRDRIALGGAAKQLTATARYADNSTEDVTASATFASGNPSKIAVSATGVAEAKALGAASLTATYGGIASSAVQATVVASTDTAQTASADTYVDNVTSTNAGTNFSAATEMKIKTEGADRRAGYVKASASPPAGIVDTVRLRLYVASAQAGADLRLYGIEDDSWVPAQITADNQPAAVSTDMDLGTVSSLTGGAYVTFDVTRFYERQTDGTLSFRVVTGVPAVSISLRTIEAGTAAQAPTLIYTVINQ